MDFAGTAERLNRAEVAPQKDVQTKLGDFHNWWQHDLYSLVEESIGDPEKRQEEADRIKNLSAEAAKSELKTKYTEICAEAKIRLFFLRPAGLSCAKCSEPEAKERKWKLRRGEGLTLKWMAGGVNRQTLYDCRAQFGKWVKNKKQVPMLQRISIWGARPPPILAPPPPDPAPPRLPDACCAPSATRQGQATGKRRPEETAGEGSCKRLKQAAATGPVEASGRLSQHDGGGAGAGRGPGRAGA